MRVFLLQLWLALSDRHLHTSGIDWNKEQAKCLSEATWLDDDEELGIQIVKDLHRTGSSLFSGPNGNINQGKLKSVLLGYARWNPEVGYCQVDSLKFDVFEWASELSFRAGLQHARRADSAGDGQERNRGAQGDDLPHRGRPADRILQRVAGRTAGGHVCVQ